MLLHQLDNLCLEESGQESQLREYQCVIQRLMTNLVHATLVLNTIHLTPGWSGTLVSSVSTAGLFGILGCTELTPSPSRSCGFSMKSSNLAMNITNNPSFRQKNPGVPDGSDGSDRTSYPLKENYTLPVTQATGHLAYVPALLCTWNVVTYTHHQNDTCVSVLAGAAGMLQLFTQCPGMFMPFPSWVPHFTSTLLLYIGSRTLTIYVQLWDVGT